MKSLKDHPKVGNLLLTTSNVFNSEALELMYTSLSVNTTILSLLYSIGFPS